MKVPDFALKIGLPLVLVVGTDAFWRMPCKGRTGLARIDPLVNFGTVADHVHAIHGSNGFSTTATTDDLLAGDCTSCGVSQDKSAYWHPALYFRNAAGEFKVVNQVGGMLAYYLLEPKNEKLRAYPKGFEMLAGDSNQRNFTYPVPDVEKSHWTGELKEQKFLKQWALGFNCLNYKAAPEPALYRHFLPEKSYLDKHCTEGIRLELMFPSCWDGKNLAGINNDKRSHVAYPSLGNTGTCPEGFPVRLISLFFESIWNTYEFKDQEGQFVFSNGDPTGYGYHGDFITGWDEAFLQSAADQCKSESGKIEDCPIFTLQDEGKMNSCQIPTAKKNSFVSAMAAVFKEKVTDKLFALPGDVQIKAGPAYAKDAAPVKAKEPIPPVDVPTLSHSDAPVAPTPAGYPPGIVLKETSVSIASSSSISSSPTPSPPEPSPTPAVTPAPSISTGPDDIYFSTEYVTRGQEVIEILWVEKVVTVTAGGVVKERRRRQHAHGHRRRAAH